MTGEPKLAAPCGVYCAECKHYPADCAGCGYIEGRPFWVGEYGMYYCALYNCCVNRSGLEHCGECIDFPCDILTTLADPTLTEEEAAASLEKRQKALRRRKEIGTAGWLAEEDK